VIIGMLVASTTCSFAFGWLIAAPFWALLAVVLVYGFSAVGDSPVLSVGFTEVVAPQVLGSALAVRSLLGFGAGWGWAYGLLRLGGLAGLASTAWLRLRPESRRMAGGRR